MHIFKKENLFQHKENYNIVYFLEDEAEFVKTLPIKVTNFSLSNPYSRIEKKVFNQEYMNLQEDFSLTKLSSIRSYIEQILEVKELEEKFKFEVNVLNNLLEENKNDLETFSEVEFGNVKERKYHYKNQIYTSKISLALALGVTVITLNKYIDRNVFDHFLLTESEVEIIANQIQKDKEKKKYYRYGDYKSSSLSSFLYKLKIPYNAYYDWRELGHKKEELYELENVELFLQFVKERKYKKQKK